MTTVFVFIMVLLYAGPCALAYYLGYKKGYIIGEDEGIKKERDAHRMDIPNSPYCDFGRDWR